MPNARSFGIFTIGFAELLKADLVSWTPKDGQALLSDRGIDYIKEHPEISNVDADDRYTF